MDEDTQKVIGRAKTALVAENERAVVSEIVVCRTKQRHRGRRLRFIGNVKFSEQIKKQTKNIILPIIDRITDQLKLSRKNFEVSAVNLAAASVRNVGVDVSGFSAEVPTFTAILSAALQLPLSSNFVSTGHISSVAGHINAVEGIPAKVEAAKNDSFIKYFICPEIEKDQSLKVLSPRERNRDSDAIVAPEDSIRIKVVGRIDQLVRLVFAEENIVLVSLREGFFNIPETACKFNNPIDGVVSFLTCNNQRRFWNTLNHQLLAGHCKKGKELLDAFVWFYLKEQLYPADFGKELFQLVCSLPPVIREQKMDFPIIEKTLCHKLGKLASQEKDYDDAHILYKAACGKVDIPKMKDSQSSSINMQPEINTTDGDHDCLVFDTVVSQIKERAVAEHVDSSIDSARGSFILESSTVETYEEFIDGIVAYYIHMQRYVSSSPDNATDVTRGRTEAIALLQRTFRNKGGDQAAFARARDGIKGGLRSILDDMTEQYKAEKTQAYIEMVFNDAIEAMGWNERVTCIRGLIKRMGQSLPEEIRNEPPERFARHYKPILKVYVKSLDNIDQLLRTM
jgi:hypothetical protein